MVVSFISRRVSAQTSRCRHTDKQSYLQYQSAWNQAAFLRQQLHVCKQLIKEGNYSAAKSGLENTLSDLLAGWLGYIEACMAPSVNWCGLICKAAFLMQSQLLAMQAY